ncbi:MAG: ORF6N domain-containing protein [Chitinophagaceae bacterium]
MRLQVIQSRIYEIREQKVMLDFNLAPLYEVETRVFNQAVKRNIASFPRDFMFRLTAKEWKSMSSQIVMTSTLSKRPQKALPYAFTEHGVTMLASILKSPKARKMNIAIVRAFIEMRKLAIQHKNVWKHLEELRTELHQRLGEHDTQLSAIYDAIENLLDEKAEKKSWEGRERIGFRK